ncbi:ATP-binding protein [Amycolatopsis pithecellobii]|uniref:DUF87 domain-containing protein n=1 Tax=Amycolatopsis pithecellobii TaxID=664692 RepID=A0A6N7Z8W1_9PSEU|nr:DUF87 domain-containing protein [Amycolatopsis pithecellobii]MTD58250.1 DUF87 domain-containing protein [Amycolatopsis pithecellobii]
MEPLAALRTLRLDWADTPDHVWRDSPYHVDGLHEEATAAIDVGIRDAAASDGPSPIGLVLQGPKGAGKTHLLSLVRKRVHQAGGYFFLANLSGGEAFWDNTAEALRAGLLRRDDSGGSQLTSFLLRVCHRGGVDQRVARTVLNGRKLSRGDVDAFVTGLRRIDEQVAVECADIARALVVYGSEDTTVSQIGEDYLGGYGETKKGEWGKWGIRPRLKTALAQVRDITRLLALSGPIAIGVDQLDTLIARSSLLAKEAGRRSDDDLLVAQIADGLMGLREVTRRTITVLTCLPPTWAQLKAKAADTVPDRFRETLTVGRVMDAALGRAIVERRLGVAYEAMGFVPPHPAWPVASAAFGEAWEPYAPRELLKRIGAHIDACLRAGQTWELTSFGDVGARPVTPVHPTGAGRFAELDRRFAELKAEADVSKLLDEASESEQMPVLIDAALRAWIFEVGNDNMEWNSEPANGSSQVHALLTRTVLEAADLEEYWAFRVIIARHPRAALSRLRKARAATGQRAGNQHLVVLRPLAWSKGEKTRLELKDFRDTGGYQLELSELDVRTFWALGQLLAGGGTELHEWLVDRRPAGQSAPLSAVMPKKSTEDTAPAEGSVTLGRSGDEPLRIELSALRKHAAVFAGSGSGKTVLLRRIIEECALGGVSSIVLDPNNDLARLGDAWPEPPQAWGAQDAALAGRYLAETDVVVWTPGRATGRPLAFAPLPDFAGVLDDEDEFTLAVEVAVATVAPQAGLTGTTRRTSIGLAVLRQAVEHHARTGSRSLPGLIEVLADLPDGVSTLNDSKRIAAELAEALKAATINDPLFAGHGAPVDPGMLLKPGAGKRARVSVISFLGLPADEQRQNFVNQLQMELFAWIKRNPAGELPLGGLFVMDEAQTLASSGTLTASTRSTIVLASQARKYGLGLLFATQAPKGLHNQVTGNAMTQFFGRLNSPAQIAAANELARAKGSQVADISRLERAQFYVAGESFGFRQITTPLCLTHHPSSPLTPEEVLKRARRGEE